MDSGVFRLVRIGGIEIKAHWSWLLILVLITYTTSVGTFPALLPRESTPVYLTLGFVAALLLFASVLLHELSHAFVARARGLRVRDITLFIFGGAANIEDEPQKPGDEFLVAVVGPFTSLVLAGIFFGLLLIVEPPVRRAGAYASAIFLYLAYINFILALFNMIPGFPLDGGRVLRSIIWGIGGNFQSATRIAGFLGQLVAYGFIAWGLYQAFFSGGFDSSGLWLAFIGWFLLNAAQQSVASATVRQVTRGVRVGQLMQQPPPIVSPNITLAHLLTQYVLPYNLRALPVGVEGEQGKITGIVTLSDIKDVPQEQWGTVTVGQVMTGQDKLRVVTAQDSLDRALEVLSEGDFDQLPVVGPDGRLQGMLSRAQILRWMQIRDELKLQPSA